MKGFLSKCFYFSSSCGIFCLDEMLCQPHQHFGIIQPRMATALSYGVFFTGIVLLFRNLGVLVQPRRLDILLDVLSHFHELIWFFGGLSISPLFETSFLF